MKTRLKKGLSSNEKDMIAEFLAKKQATKLNDSGDDGKYTSYEGRSRFHQSYSTLHANKIVQSVAVGGQASVTHGKLDDYALQTVSSIKTDNDLLFKVGQETRKGQRILEVIIRPHRRDKDRKVIKYRIEGIKGLLSHKETLARM